MLILSLLVILFLGYCTPTNAEAPSPLLAEMPITTLISHFSVVYGASTDELTKVMKCESNFNPKAVGDGGKARNVYQYHKPTFDAFSKDFGEQLDYNSYYDQIKLTAWAFSKGKSYKRHWTCSKLQHVI